MICSKYKFDEHCCITAGKDDYNRLRYILEKLAEQDGISVDQSGEIEILDRMCNDMKVEITRLRNENAVLIEKHYYLTQLNIEWEEQFTSNALDEYVVRNAYAHAEENEYLRNAILQHRDNFWAGEYDDELLYKALDIISNK